MNYLELDIEVSIEFVEILVAELAEIDFESFIDTPVGLKAYIGVLNADDNQIRRILEKYAYKTPLHYSISEIEKQNWNKDWESNFSPIEIGKDIRIRADFHEHVPGFTHEIIITPKMSFGTGHHDTTAQMMILQLEIDHRNKLVLDVGTGTGILAILAKKLGASRVHAFDIDEWSVENTIENIQMNNVAEISASRGTIQSQTREAYDIILANINRNILLDELSEYAAFMRPSAYILMSGFYENDVDDIVEEGQKVGLKKEKQISKNNNWAAIVLKKID